MSFEQERPRLFGLAYRMLGSLADAEDVVQECYLRWQAHQAPVRSLPAFLTTVTTRLCLDQLKSARRRRETYLGVWLPEPVPTESEGERLESLSLAFLTLLEQLQPLERAVLLLREVFAYEFAEVAAILGRSEGSCRKALSRARQHLRGRPRFEASGERHGQLLSSYIQAVQTGEVDELTGLLAEDVVLWADGAGRVPGAVLHPIRGPRAVASVVLGTRRFWPRPYELRRLVLNGRESILVLSGGRPFATVSLEVRGDRILSLWIQANPDKLASLA